MASGAIGHRGQINASVMVNNTDIDFVTTLRRNLAGRNVLEEILLEDSVRLSMPIAKVIFPILHLFRGCELFIVFIVNSIEKTTTHNKKKASLVPLSKHNYFCNI
jgi:hypothetical protein